MAFVEFIMRSTFIAITLLAVSRFAAAQPIEWQSYEIAETGAKVDLPVTIFSKSAGHPESGYGAAF
jgi:hypothetical protein